MSNLNSQFSFNYGLPYPGASGKTPAQIMENINYLYKKMDQCTRNVTYFDLYKFSTIIEDSSQLQAQVNALLPYTSAIVNTNIETSDGMRYAPGDIIVKNNDGSSDLIKAQRGGIFYPSSITREAGKNYTYDIEFSYKSFEPIEDSIDVKDEYSLSGETIQKVADQIWDRTDNNGQDIYAKNIKFIGLSGDSVGSPYNYVYQYQSTDVEEPISISIPVASKEEKQASGDTKMIDIPPIVHCYANNEEIYIDQKISYDKDNERHYKIEIDPCRLCNKVVVK